MIDDPRFDTNMHRNQNLKLIGDLLTEKTRTKTTAEWLDILEKAGVPFGIASRLLHNLPLYRQGFGWVCVAAGMLAVSFLVNSTGVCQECG